jgi:hypothetical protein
VSHDNAQGFRVDPILDLFTPDGAGPLLLPHPAGANPLFGVENLITRLKWAVGNGTAEEMLQGFFEVADFVNAHEHGREYVQQFMKDDRMLQLALLLGGECVAGSRRSLSQLLGEGPFALDLYGFPRVSTEQVLRVELMTAVGRTHADSAKAARVFKQTVGAILRVDFRELPLATAEILMVAAGAHGITILALFGIFVVGLGVEAMGESDTFAMNVTEFAIKHAEGNVELRGVSDDWRFAFYRVWPGFDAPLEIEDTSVEFQQWLRSLPREVVSVAAYVPRLDIDVSEFVSERVLSSGASCARRGCLAIPDRFDVPATGFSGVMDRESGLCVLSFGGKSDGDAPAPVYKHAGPCEVPGAQEAIRIVRMEAGEPAFAEFHALQPAIAAVAGHREIVAGVAMICLAWKVARFTSPSGVQVADIIGAPPRTCTDAMRFLLGTCLRVFPDGPHLGQRTMIDDRMRIADRIFATGDPDIIARWAERITILDAQINSMVRRHDKKRVLTVSAGRIALGLLEPDAINESGLVSARRLVDWLVAIGVERIPQTTVADYLELLPACLRAP